VTDGIFGSTNARVERNAIGLFYADARDVSAAAIDQWVTDEDRERLTAAARQLRRTQYLTGRALLRFALERWTGLPAASHRLRVREGGKPECMNGPAISVSHDRSSVACAITASGEIGVDVQHVESRRRTIDIARRYFSQAENAWLENARPDAFYMLWVLKEAYLKALGTGIAGGLDALECRVEPPMIDAKTAVPASLALYSVDGAYLGIAVLGCRVEESRIECWQPFRTSVSPPPRLIATSAWA
jgi:4'-phosphopantetheinyl transferase